MITSKKPSATADEIYTTLKKSSLDLGTLGRDNYYGWGRVDAYKALQTLGGITVKDITPPVVIPPPNQVVNAVDQNGAIVNYPPATATDNIGVTSGPTCIPASGSTFPIGITIVTCTASDAAGNIGSATFTITVNNVVQDDTTRPTVSITSPAASSPAGAIVKGIVTVSVSAFDDSGISKIEIYINDILTATLNKLPYDFSWDTTAISDGYYTIIAKAYDTHENTSSAVKRVKVYNNQH